MRKEIKIFFLCCVLIQSPAKEMNNKTELFKKLLSVQQKLRPIAETGKNTYQRYSYATALDILEPVKKACNELGLFIYLDVTESEIEAGKARCTVKLTTVDCETGESLSINSCGYSEDWSYKENRPTGAKAIYKAITGATKYAVREMFALASTDDPEKEEMKQQTKSKPRTINQAQVNRLYKLATEEIGLSKERAKEVLQSCGYYSAKNIIYEDYERVVKTFQELGQLTTTKATI